MHDETLTNAVTHRGAALKNAALITPNANDAAEGVSVRYAYDPAKQWFVLRATYGRAPKAAEYIARDGTEVYIPRKRILAFREMEKGGRPQRVLTMVPVLSNFLFVYATAEKTDRYVRDTPALPYVSYYYDHFRKTGAGTNPPLTVGYREMMNFINFMNVRNDNVFLADPRYVRYKTDDRVRIICGDFQGIEGRVVRYAGQQRVALTLHGLCTVLTAYIPTAFIEKI